MKPTDRTISRREILSALVELHAAHGVRLPDLHKALSASDKGLKLRIGVTLNTLRKSGLAERVSWGAWQATDAGVSWLLQEREPLPAPQAAAPKPGTQPITLSPADIDAIAHRVVELLAQRLPAPPAKPSPTAGPAPTPVKPLPPKPAPVSRMGRPSVLIVGLLGDQAHTVQNRYGKALDISCIDSQNANVHTIKNACRRRDHVIQMTSFTAHTTDNAIRCATGQPAIRVNGSVSSLFRELDRIATHGSPLQ